MLPSRRGWAWDPSTPLAGLWERTEYKERGWPSELGDRAARIQAHPELGESNIEASSPQRMSLVVTHILSGSHPLSEGEVGWGCAGFNLLPNSLSEEISLL